MNELSSNFLFYRTVITWILFPFIMVVFINVFWVNNFSNLAVIISYIVVGLLTIRQVFKLNKYRMVFYDERNMLLRNYFSKRSTEVPITNIINIKKAFSLARKSMRMTYKITYTDENGMHSIYFYKTPRLYSTDDLNSIIRKNIIST